ncbi:MAG: alpha/beta hydrolase [Anaerolineae bacterium]|nr:alpha/beta hydrolase [Anaerolineae bacterium]
MTGNSTDYTTGYVTANGLSLHYYRANNRTPNNPKPPLILLHGVTDNGLCWARTADALAEDWDVILPDARGHGLSDKPDTGYSPADHVADVIGLIAALGLDRPAVLGHSMGGEITATIAATIPGQIRAVVLEDPPWSAQEMTREERLAIIPDWRAGLVRMQAQSREDLFAQIREEAPGWHESEYGPWVDAKRQLTLNVLQYIEANRASWRELLPRITCPLLLVHAEVDRGGIVTPPLAEEIAARPNVEAVFIPDAGHSIRRDQYEAYLAAVRDFLGRYTTV